MSDLWGITQGVFPPFATSQVVLLLLLGWTLDGVLVFVGDRIVWMVLFWLLLGILLSSSSPTAWRATVAAKTFTQRCGSDRSNYSQARAPGWE